MKYRAYMITGLAVVAFLLGGQYGVTSYFNARHLKARAETMTVSTRLMKHQVGELEQKARILNRVQHFMDSAHSQRLTPDNWSAYDVQIQDVVAFQELAQIVEQCVHNKDLYYKPISFHVAVGQDKDASSELEGSMEPVPPLSADAVTDGPTDVSLALQGTFLVRH